MKDPDREIAPLCQVCSGYCRDVAHVARDEGRKRLSATAQTPFQKDATEVA